MNVYSIAIHGGAGTLQNGLMTPELEKEYRNQLQSALDIGFSILSQSGSAVQAVEQSVISLEDSPLFNAGKGSVFAANGTHEMDASIMNGKSLQAGAISLVTGIKNPISLAREVMEHSEHVFLAGEGAIQFATKRGYRSEDESYFFDEFRHQQWLEIKDTENFQLDHSAPPDSKFGTVGAVACDQHGNLAAATSTGGMTNKRFGRIGDSPIIGAGCYANNRTCAVSCTGSGEYFIRGVVAYDVACLIEHKGMTLGDASAEVINNRVAAIGGDGGLIAVDRRGNLAMPFNTEGMYRASQSSNGEAVVGIYREPGDA